MLKKASAVLILPLIILCCSQGQLDFKIKYDSIEGLKEGDRVVFDGNQIGTVERVFHTEDGYYLIDVSIRPNFSNAVTEHSRFFIVNDPENSSERAVEMTQVSEGGDPLAEGVVVEGSTRASAVIEKFQNKVDSGIEGLNDQLGRLKEKFKDIEDNEKYKELKDKIDEITEKMKNAGKAAREKIEKEVIPKLREELEDLKEKFSRPEPEKEEKAIET